MSSAFARSSFNRRWARGASVCQSISARAAFSRPSFARPGGAYIADVDVEIGNGRGTVVRAHCGGPLMLVDLAGSGTWEVTARAQGQTQRKSVTLTGKPATLAFTWPG